MINATIVSYNLSILFSVAAFQAEEGKRSLPKGAHVRFDVENLGASNSKCKQGNSFATDFL